MQVDLAALCVFENKAGVGLDAARIGSAQVLGPEFLQPGGGVRSSLYAF
jgi:hypothetical protein